MAQQVVTKTREYMQLLIKHYNLADANSLLRYQLKIEHKMEQVAVILLPAARALGMSQVNNPATALSYVHSVFYAELRKHAPVSEIDKLEAAQSLLLLSQSGKKSVRFNI
jgi:hypothetical protein